MLASCLGMDVVHGAGPAHASNIVGDKYGSPDGIYVAPSGRLWIQTDVSGSSINPENRAGAYSGPIGS